MSRAAISKRTLPEGWREVRLEDVTDKSMYGLNAKAVKFDGKNKYLRITDIDEKSHRFVPNPITSPAGKIREEYKLVENDLVFARTGASVGKTYLFDKSDGDIYFAGYLIKFHIPNENAKFIFNQTLLGSYDNWVKSMSTRSGQPGINMEEFKKLPIVLTSLPEQQAIAETLQAWDTAIEKTEKLITEKEKQFGWLVDMLIGRRCKVWRHLKTESIFSIVSKRNKKNAQLLSVTQDRGVIPRSMLEGRVMSPAGSTSNYKVIRKGNFAIGLRSFQGGIEYSEYCGAISPAYTVLKSKREICEGFYKHFFKTRLFVDKYLRIAVIGIRDGKQISIPDFETVQLPYPPLAEQRQVAIFLDSAKREILAFREIVRQYQKQKRRLIQKLMTGEWRVKQ